MPWESIRTKIIFLVLAITLITGIFTIIVVHRSVSNSTSEKLDDGLSSNAFDISDELKEPLEDGDASRIQVILKQRMQNNEDLEYIFVVDTEGNFTLSEPSDFDDHDRIINSNSLKSNMEKNIDDISLSSGEVRDIGVQIDDGRLGTLHLGVSTDSITSSADTAIIPMMIGFIIILVTVMIGIILSVRSGIETESADGTVRHDPSNSADVKQSKDILDKSSTIYEHELESTKQALRESESKYKGLINNLRSAILTIDKTGLILTINKSGVILLGCKSMEDAKNSNLFKDFGIPKEDCKSFIKMLREKGFIENFETMIIKMNGEKAIVRITSQVIRDEKDRIERIDSIIRDITLQKVTEREKSKLEAELFHAEKLASIGQLAAGVAHEINNPLTNISLLTTSVRRKTKDPMIIEKLDKLTQQRKIAAKIVADLLQFSRKTEPKFTKINLADTISEALGQTVKEGHSLIMVKNNTEGEEIFVRGDPDLLRQVFINLFENAYDSMGETGKMTIGSRSIGVDFIEIEIADSGPGIPDNIFPKIFDPFYSTKQAEMGTGLGLSICHGIIKTHEGKIYARNREPRGASFLIQLPRWKDEV